MTHVAAMQRRLTQHFTLRELTRSETADRHGIANIPDAAGVARLTDVCLYILEPVRAVFGPVTVRSGYRSPEVNARIAGASRTSEHRLCRAVDFEVQGTSNFDVAGWIAHGGLPRGFYQLILEAYIEGDPNSGWVHCSLPLPDERPKVMTMVRRRGPKGAMQSVYLPGLVR